METVTDFIFGSSKITADGDSSHEIKRHLLLGRKAITNIDSVLKSRDITLLTKVHPVKAMMVFPTVMYAAKSLQLCPTVRPHRRQPTRLPRPGDSPGKNTGVGCHFLLQCMKVKSESEVTQSCHSGAHQAPPSMGFSRQECWSGVPLPSLIKKADHRRIDAFELWSWRRLLRIPWTARRSNQSNLKEISPEYSLEGLILKLKR